MCFDHHRVATDVVKIVEELVKRLQPRVVYTHHGNELDIDHHVVVHWLRLDDSPGLDRLFSKTGLE